METDCIVSVPEPLAGLYSQYSDDGCALIIVNGVRNMVSYFACLATIAPLDCSYASNPDMFPRKVFYFLDEEHADSSMFAESSRAGKPVLIE